MSKKNTQFIVLGLGRFGRGIVQTLVENSRDVLAVDKDADVVQEVSRVATHVVRADVTDAEALLALGLNNFDCVIIDLSHDLEASVLAVMFAKEKGVKKVVVKAQSKIQKAILEKVGATRVILPEREMAIKVANSLISESVVEHINLSEKHSIAEISPISMWIGKNLVQSDIRQEYGMNIVAIKRKNTILVSPKPTEVIGEDDVIVVIGSNININKVGEIYDAEKNN